MSKTPITREELDNACNIVFADNTDFCAMKVDAVEAVRRLMMLQNAFAVLCQSMFDTTQYPMTNRLPCTRYLRQ